MIIKKDGRTVYVRDRATERFEKVGKFLNSSDFQIWFGGILLFAVIALGCLIGSAICG